MRRAFPILLAGLLGCARPETAAPPPPAAAPSAPAAAAAAEEAPADSERYDVLMREGAGLEADGKFEDALARYEAAKRIHPAELRAYHAIRTVHENADRYDLARAEIDRAVAAMADDESRARALLELGAHLSKQERFEDGIAAIDRSIALNPKEHEFYLEKGTILAKMGRDADAVVEFKRAIELDPVCQLAHANLGSAYHRMGRDDLAEPMMRRAVELAPHEEGYWRLLADFYAKTGDAARSRSVLDEMEKALGGA